jgi:uncharacterized protein DUF7010/uncharacterized protein DUF6609
MNIEDAQQEVRSVYVGGFPGAMVSGLIWAIAAAIASPGFLIVGGVFIFPLTQLALRLSGRPAALRNENPLRWLAMQIAFTIPLTIPLALVAYLHKYEWFFPAMLVIVGAHYLPFVFLYGMRVYALIAGVMVGSGLGIAMYAPRASFVLGGWIGAAIEITFGVAGLAFSVLARRSATPA